MTDDNVLILGCGPAGLLAAYAVERAGGSPAIMSRKVKSELPGAQYLHEAIPGLCDAAEPDGVIRTIQRGTAEGYAAKVYGNPNQPTSWVRDADDREQPAWDLRAVYALLWDRYQARILDTEITREDLNELPRNFPLVISTIWAPQVCLGVGPFGTMYNINHYFRHESMFVIEWAPPDLPDNTVLYSGEPDTEWYRSSRVFGHASSEGTQHSMTSPVEYTPIDTSDQRRWLSVKKGIKVVETNCDCRPEIKRAGRYATWRKRYLTHHAFADATAHYNEAFASSR
jgi:hypothetical protein